MTNHEAVVVGSGPNGLSAAVVLAESGYDVAVLEAKATIGGGTRTEELTLPGFHHDVCSAFHPLGAVSEAFTTWPLAEHGLEWIHPEVQLAHPLDDGSAGALFQSMVTTTGHLGGDGKRWQRLVGPIVDRWDDIAPHIMGPLITMSRHPGAAFAIRNGLLPAAVVARRFRSQQAKALFGGIAAHSMMPMTSLMTASPGIVLGALAHVGGWPLARGGSAAITSALASYLTSLGGTIFTDHPVRTPGDLPTSRVVLFDTTPSTLAEVYGAAVPGSMKRWISRYRYGVGSYKVDFALDGPIPWTAAECRRAGTVHVGGTFSELAAAEATVAAGANPDKPFVLVGQQSLFDDSRAPVGRHTAWAYTHVPNGFCGSVAAQIESQIERFAPGFRDLVLARNLMGTHDLESHNPNYRGGDIAAGATSFRQMIARPRFSANPYRTAIPGVYLCSASTPPGPGVHGLCGLHAANAAIAGHLGSSGSE